MCNRSFRQLCKIADVDPDNAVNANVSWLANLIAERGETAFTTVARADLCVEIRQATRRYVSRRRRAIANSLKLLTKHGEDG